MNLDAVKQTFIVESNELLDDMESSLLLLEKKPDNHEAIHAVFRAAHTIKGSSGMFGYNGIVDFTHYIESFLDDLRQLKFQVNSDIIASLLECRDHIITLIDIYSKNDKAVLSPAMTEKGDNLLRVLKSLAPESGAVTTMKNDSSVPSTEKVQQKSGLNINRKEWHISLRFYPDILQHGLDPISFVNYLTKLGEITNLYTITDKIPPLHQMDPEKCFMGMEILLLSGSQEAEIKSVFEFLYDDAEIVIIPPHSDINRYRELITQLPEERNRLKEIFLENGILSEKEWSMATTAEAPVMEKPVVSEVKNTSQEIPDQNANIVQETFPSEDNSKSVAETAAKFIRIEAQKLDSLINLVGELVINVANIRQISEKAGEKEMLESAVTMSRLVEEVRDSAMNIRMVLIGDTFKRFERVVRDLGRKMNKEIILKISGGETELDKTVVEKINDPLMHIIRNSIDHGIGTPDERKKMGKAPAGTIHVNAFHDTGNIVIEISDDGNGLNKDRILKKAIEKGLASHGIEYSDSEIYKFIFEPGFSTAEKVTDVSGRGVGMDVVKRNIESLRGTVDIDSQTGVGTTIRIALPLTLAIIDGFLVEIGKSSYVIPLDMVLECININTEGDTVGHETGDFVNLRGEVLPYLRMRDFFDEDQGGNVEGNIIVVKYGQQKAGLLVDKLLGEFQTVIKPLGKLFTNLQGISGATILGSGSVALILDIPRLIRYAQSLESMKT